MADRQPETAREAVIRLREEGLSWSQCAAVMRKSHPEEFGRLSETQAYTKCRNIHRRAPVDTRWQPGQSGNPEGRKPVITEAPPDPQDILMKLLERGMGLEDIAGHLGVSARVAEAMVQDLREGGFNIQEDAGGALQIRRILPPTSNWQVKPWGGETLLRFGLVSDTHIGGVDTQLTLLHHLYDHFAREGITDIYHCGDLTDGEKMRPGQEYELYRHGADAQVAHTVAVYPKRPGMVTRFITGNHDYAFIKSIGLDIGRQVAAQREDMEYLGYMSATVQLSPGCTLELRHPQDGSAYAISYKLQKMIEAMAGGEKPSILAVGHYHKASYFEYRNIHALQVPTTQAQTNFMRGKGLSAQMGGIIVELKLRDDGVISEFVPRFVPFYKGVRDDYKQWI